MSKRPKNRLAACRLIVTLTLFASVFIPVCAEAEGRIVIFLSAEEAAYLRPVEVFADEVNRPTEILNMEGNIDRGMKMMGDVLDKTPSLIFTLGAKATYIAKKVTFDRKRQEIPIVFARVINWERYGLLNDSGNICGISAEVDAGTQMFNLRMFTPNVRTVGVVYSGHSTQIVDRAKMVIAMLGIEIIDAKIAKHGEFRNAYEKMSGKIQAFWILQDPNLFTVENMNWLVEQAKTDKIITLGQSENIAKTGATIAITIDEHNIGTQAASIAKDLLSANQQAKDIGVMPPLGTKIYLNMKTANKITLAIPPDAKNSVSEIFE